MPERALVLDFELVNCLRLERGHLRHRANVARGPGPRPGLEWPRAPSAARVPPPPAMIDVTKLGKSYGARTLFEDVSLKLVPGPATGSSAPTDPARPLPRDPRRRRARHGGHVTLVKAARVGVLAPGPLPPRRGSHPRRRHRGRRAGHARARRAEAARGRRRARSGPPRRARGPDRAHDGYTLEARASAILEGLGIPVASHRLPLATLSGGFKLRVLLAQVLLGGPDVLLLDEPTNHLDILSIRWLEQFLAGYQGCALVISHDERFLDNVATHILDVDYGTITLYTGNYSAFAVEKVASAQRKEAEIARAEATIAEKRAWVERFGAKATKARQAQSRLKQIEKIEVAEIEDDLSPHAALPVHPAAAERAGRARDRRGVEGVRREAGAPRRVDPRSARRAGRDHRTERARQIHPREDRDREPRRPTPGG